MSACQPGSFRTCSHPLCVVTSFLPCCTDLIHLPLFLVDEHCFTRFASCLELTLTTEHFLSYLGLHLGLELCNLVMTTCEKNMEDLNLPGGIPVDPDYGESSEYPEDDVADSAYSQASSIHNFRVEHGRRYHEYKEGHPFPYDEITRKNEVCFHELIYLLLDHRYFLAPLDESNLRHVADVGTGDGFWAEAVAQRYPDTEVVGIDTIFHGRSIEPNCSYLVQDVTEEWVLDQPSMLFDLIHIRNLFVGVTDWQPVYAQCFE